jgi:eukaryotic-like serine/threonine-protein kinase
MNEEPTIPFGVHEAGRAESQPSAETAWGSFTLLARVGAGGFGEVYRAWDSHLQREVALKLLLPGAVGGEAEYEAMLREARALASVRHPNIVPVHGIDRHDGRVGFWTDFVHGKTLSVLLREQGTFGSREAALIGLDVAKALSAVHRAGLLHRDIKAENVMREEGGRILLMDFGLSAFEQRAAEFAGTPNYMAPELFRGGQSTVATDIYAMGVLLYYLVAGDYPAKLTGLTALESLAKFAQRKPLMDLRPDLPDSLLRTVDSALEMDPAKRFASAGRLASALADSLGTAPPAEIAAAPDTNNMRKARRRVKMIAGVVIAVALAAAIAVWLAVMPKRNHSASGGVTTASATMYDQFQKAQELLLRPYKTVNREGAVKGFQAVLQADPGFALAQARLGGAYFVEYLYSRDPKLLDSAKDATNRALNLDPNLAPPYVTLSRIAAMQGQTALAMQHAQKALSLDPRSAEAYGALADVYTAQGKDDDAVTAYQKAIDLAPDDWRWPVRLGNEEIGAGNLKDAIAQFQRAVELAPDSAFAYFDLGVAHMQSDQMDAAQKDLETSLQIEPNAQAYRALGTVLLLEGKHADAAGMYQKSIDMTPYDYKAWGNLGIAYRWSGTHPEKATEAYKKAIELAETERKKTPEDPELLVALADYYASTGGVNEALKLLRQALALDPGSPSIEYEAGETYESLGERSKAIVLITKAVARGYHHSELDRNPDLAALRADPAFVAALHSTQNAKK